METLKRTLGITFLIISFLSTNQTYAQKRNNSFKKTAKTEYTGNRVNYHNRYRAQPIYRNPAYRYPNHRRVIRTLPIHHVRITYRGLPYFYYSGVYYTMYGNEYIVVLPPRGFRITVLPVNHIRLVIGTSVYFYHSGIYYTASTTTSTDSEKSYEVTKPPIGIVLYDIPNEAKVVIIDGNTYYEFNDILYKKGTDLSGKTTYEVVYCKSTEA